ncbi:hypothetical protein D3C87_176100 [compost metagenome]
MILSLLLFLGISTAHAADPYVVDVRRNITLADDDPVYKDFYINVTPGSGLKKNLVVTAVRKINIRDASGANAMGEIFIPVGQLKIIAVFDKIAVAREFTLLSRDELPMLEQIGIMTGDTIDLKGSFIDTSKPKRKKVAEAEPPVTSTTENLVAIATPLVLPTSAPLGTQTAAVPVAPVTLPTISSDPTAQKLEKTADSDNNTQHE